MADNTVLQMVMLEEYDRLLRLIQGIENELDNLPHGYISKKMIRGKKNYYLQWREGDHIKSRYISGGDYSKIKEQVERRQTLEKTLRSHKNDKKRIEVALGMTFINQNRKRTLNDIL